MFFRNLGLVVVGMEYVFRLLIFRVSIVSRVVYGSDYIVVNRVKRRVVFGLVYYIVFKGDKDC